MSASIMSPVAYSSQRPLIRDSSLPVLCSGRPFETRKENLPLHFLFVSDPAPYPFTMKLKHLLLLSAWAAVSSMSTISLRNNGKHCNMRNDEAALTAHEGIARVWAARTVTSQNGPRRVGLHVIR